MLRLLALALTLLSGVLAPSAAFASGFGAPAPVTVVCQSAVQVSHTGDTSVFTLATCVIPANLIGKNGQVVIEALYSWTNNADTKSPAVKFGGNTIANSTGGAQNGVAYRARLANRNATNSQVVLNLTAGFGSYSTGPTTLTVDTTASVNVDFTCQLGTSTDTCSLESEQVTVYPHS